MDRIEVDQCEVELRGVKLILGGVSSQIEEDDMIMTSPKLLIAAVAIAAASVQFGFAEGAPSDFPVQAAFDAVAAGDVPTAVSYLSEDVVFTTLPIPVTAPVELWKEHRVLIRREEVSEWWEFGVMDNFRVKIRDLQLDGNRATFTADFWSKFFDEVGVTPLESDGLAIIRDGKVHLLVLSSTPEALAKVGAAMSKGSN